MDTVTRIHSVRERVAEWRRAGARIGFVPTMGNLHKGHLSLLTRAAERADRIVVSVFVNPLQFGPSEDFNRYPRTLEHDTELLKKSRADLLFTPTAFEMYPMGVERTSLIDVPELSGILEGQIRPGHFAGVATVVAKLFNIVQPDVAVFGEKDYQQLMIIRRMVQDLCMPIGIEGGPIVRDHDGLALSSRNQYLSPGERNRASRLYDTLRHVRQRIVEGQRRYTEVEALAMRELTTAGFEPDYVSVRRPSDLMPPRVGDEEVVVLAAARLGRTRLIDNLLVRLDAKR
ncbi:MAG: pantoate--beta-alanine ligase [Steroidobacteraceae bacterium]